MKTALLPVMEKISMDQYTNSNVTEYYLHDN